MNPVHRMVHAGFNSHPHALHFQHAGSAYTSAIYHGTPNAILKTFNPKLNGLQARSCFNIKVCYNSPKGVSQNSMEDLGFGILGFKGIRIGTLPHGWRITWNQTDQDNRTMEAEYMTCSLNS